MVRENLTPGSRNFFAGTYAGSEIDRWVSTVRLSTAGIATLAPGNSYVSRPPGFAYPNAWFRLKRLANTFTAYYGTNGVDWVQLGDQLTPVPPYPTTVHLGLATTPNGATSGQAASAQYLNFADRIELAGAEPNGRSPGRQIAIPPRPATAAGFISIPIHEIIPHAHLRSGKFAERSVGPQTSVARVRRAFALHRVARGDCHHCHFGGDAAAALAKAKAKANTIKCASNMRNWAFALQMYRDDFNDCLPFFAPVFAFSASQPYVFETLAPYVAKVTAARLNPPFRKTNPQVRRRQLFGTPVVRQRIEPYNWNCWIGVNFGHPATTLNGPFYYEMSAGRLIRR